MQKPQKKALLVQMGRQQELLKRYSHCLNFQIYHTSLFYPNFIKQLRLKGDICLALHQMLAVHPPLNMPYCWLVKVSGEVCVKSDLKLTLCNVGVLNMIGNFCSHSTQLNHVLFPIK